MTEGQAILAAGALLAVGLAASLVAGRMRVPALVLFLGIGMAVGSDGTGWIDFDNYDQARAIGVIALALILFEGGLTAGWSEIRPVIAGAVSLAIVGTAATALVGGLAAAWLLDLSLRNGLLLGAVLATTDSAAIFAVLRGSTLRRRLARTLEGEAGLNDPVAVLLVLALIEWITEPGYAIADFAELMVRQLAIGLVVGLAAGAAGAWALRRTRLASAGLYPVSSLAVAAIAFGGAEALHGSGFLSVYLAGLVLGSASIPAKRTITTFHAGLGWLAQVVMFVALGLLVFPSQLGAVALEGTVLAFVVALVARPLAVWVATAAGRYDWRERTVLGWAGLRGAVPVVLATFPVIEGVPNSREFFNIVFFAVIVSTVVQGATFEWLAEKLRVTTREAAMPSPLTDIAAVRRLGAEVVEYPVRPDDAIVGARVRQLGLPRDALVNLVVRGDRAILPRGSTRIEAGDRINLLVRQEAAIELDELLERWRSGPLGPRAKPPPGRPIHVRLTVGPYEGEGDPGRPERVRGLEVLDQLRTRRDGVPGALVLLEDGRYSFTGPVTAVGTPAALQYAARQRLRVARNEAEQAWWRDVIGALSQPQDPMPG